MEGEQHYSLYRYIQAWRLDYRRGLSCYFFNIYDPADNCLVRNKFKVSLSLLPVFDSARD